MIFAVSCNKLQCPSHYTKPLGVLRTIHRLESASNFEVADTSSNSSSVHEFASGALKKKRKINK